MFKKAKLTTIDLVIEYLCRRSLKKPLFTILMINQLPIFAILIINLQILQLRWRLIII